MSHRWNSNCFVFKTRFKRQFSKLYQNALPGVNYHSPNRNILLCNIYVYVHIFYSTSHIIHTRLCFVMLCCAVLKIVSELLWLTFLQYSWGFSLTRGKYYFYVCNMFFRMPLKIQTMNSTYKHTHMHMQMSVPLLLFSSLLFWSYISSVHAPLFIFYVRSIFSSLHIYIYIYMYIYICIYIHMDDDDILRFEY